MKSAIRVRGQPRNFLFVGIFICIILLIGLVSGNLGENNTVIVQLNVCHEQSLPEVQPETFHRDIGLLYICGLVEGDSYKRISFTLFRDGEVPFSIAERLQAGEFYIGIPRTGVNGGYPTGHYRLTASYERYPVLEVEFDITDE